MSRNNMIRNRGKHRFLTEGVKTIRRTLSMSKRSERIYRERGIKNASREGGNVTSEM